MWSFKTKEFNEVNERTVLFNGVPLSFYTIELKNLGFKNQLINIKTGSNQSV